MGSLKNKNEGGTPSQENVPNYIRLLFVTNNMALPIMRDMFCTKWKSTDGTEWENNPTFATKLIENFGQKVYKDSRAIQKKLLESGNISEWDLPLMIQLIKCLDTKCEGESISVNDTTISRSKRNKNFETLKEIRNQLAHTGSIEITKEKFEEMWKTLSDVLLSFGVSQSELDKAKVAPLLEDKNAKKDRRINDKNTENAKESKIKGNEMFKLGKYSKAIDFYTDGIQQTGIPSEDLAVLYSNRSITFLKVKDFESAKEDAKGAIHLRPTWWKAYFRLGKAYKLSENYEKALKNYELSLWWKPSDSEIKEVKEERDHCLHVINKRARYEHMDPMNSAETFEEIAEKMEKDHGIPMNPKGLHLSQKLNLNLGLTVGMCGEGHNYRIGRGVKQDFEQAAKYYAKAASKGSAEGMYNLAQLTMEGQGVKRDIAESINLLQQAASQNLTMEMAGMKFPNLGVVESEHALGLHYDEGVGVPRDFKKAFYWYTRAVKHGMAPAANNIAIMYSMGKGVKGSLTTAIDYWKLAASRKLVRAMDNLAIMYLEMGDSKNARNWYAFGIKNGSMGLKTREKEFKMLLGSTNIEKGFKEDVFELELLDEVRNGPLKHLICDDVPNMNSTVDLMKNLKTTCEETATSRKENGLTDPYRVFIVTDHRNSVKIMMKKGDKAQYEANPAKLQSKTPLDLIGLKSIHFKDMDASKDHIYEGFVIKLTLIEDAVLGKPSIAQIGEDENGDAQRLFIYNFAQNKETQDSLGFGCKISIVNPYFRITMDGKPAIRVDDSSLLFLHSNLTDKKRCRYCGKEKSTVPCRRCRRSFYCSKQCLLKDTSDMSHELVCLKRM